MGQCDVICSLSCTFAQMKYAVTNATDLSFVMTFFCNGGGCEP